MRKNTILFDKLYLLFPYKEANFVSIPDIWTLALNAKFAIWSKHSVGELLYSLHFNVSLNFFMKEFPTI